MPLRDLAHFDVMAMYQRLLTLEAVLEQPDLAPPITAYAHSVFDAFRRRLDSFPEVACAVRGRIRNASTIAELCRALEECKWTPGDGLVGTKEKCALFEHFEDQMKACFVEMPWTPDLKAAVAELAELVERLRRERKAAFIKAVCLDPVLGTQLFIFCQMRFDTMPASMEEAVDSLVS